MFKSEKELLEAQLELAKHSCLEIRMKLATLDNLYPEVQLILAKDDILVRKILACRENLTLEVERLLANTADEDVRSNLAWRVNCPEIQNMFAKDTYRVKKELSRNSKLIPEVQQLLAKDPHEWIRRFLALNPRITPEIQKILAKDLDEETLKYLAQNTSITLEVQHILAKDPSAWVRTCLACNYNLISDIQDFLAKDSNENVRYRLFVNPNVQKHIKEKLDCESFSLLKEVIDAAPSIIPKYNADEKSKEIDLLPLTLIAAAVGFNSIINKYPEKELSLSKVLEAGKDLEIKNTTR